MDVCCSVGSFLDDGVGPRAYTNAPRMLGV